jgi:hypothetical protein
MPITRHHTGRWLYQFDRVISGQRVRANRLLPQGWTRTQALAFPRAWMYRPDGYAIASNLIAPWLIDATARLAFWLSQQENPYVSNGLQPGTELQLPGGLRLTPGSSSQLPIDVRQLIRPYLSGGGSSLVRA